MGFHDWEVMDGRGASMEATLELWASLLRDVKARMRGSGRQCRQQAILGRGRWDEDALRDIMCNYVLETLADPDAVLGISPSSQPGVRPAHPSRRWLRWKGIAGQSRTVSRPPGMNPASITTRPAASQPTSHGRASNLHTSSPDPSGSGHIRRLPDRLILKKMQL